MTNFTLSNRALWARRYNWPPGALEICNSIEEQYPDWHPLWEPGSDSGSRQQRGYYATRRGDTAMQEPLYGVTPEDLVERIQLANKDRLAKDADRERWVRMWIEADREISNPRAGRR